MTLTARVRAERGAQAGRGLRGRRHGELPRVARPRRVRARTEHRALRARRQPLAHAHPRHARRAHRGTQLAVTFHVFDNMYLGI